MDGSNEHSDNHSFYIILCNGTVLQQRGYEGNVNNAQRYVFHFL